MEMLMYKNEADFWVFNSYPATWLNFLVFKISCGIVRIFYIEDDIFCKQKNIIFPFSFRWDW